MFKWFYDKKHPELKHLDGPPPLFPIGNLVDFIVKKPWDLVDEYTKRYGKFFKGWLGVRPIIYILKYEAIEQVFKLKREDYYKEMPTSALFPFISKNGIFSLNGQQWKHGRENSFHLNDKLIEVFEAEFKNITGMMPGLIEKWKVHKKSSNLATRLEFLFQDLIHILCTGRDIEKSVLKSFRKQTPYGDMSIKANFPVVSPMFFYHRYKWMMYWKNQVNSPTTGGIIGHLKKGSTLPRELFTHEIASQFWGGGFSGAAVLVNALYHLAKEKRNLDELIGDFDSYEELNKHLPLERVVRETMRLCPPVPLYGRTVLAPTSQLMDTELKKNTMVFFSCRPFHHDSEKWQEPLSFQPERWDKNTLAENDYGTSHFMPFGVGPRSCVGQEMAIFLIKTGLYGILKNHKLEIDPRPPTQKFIFGTQLPRGIKGKIFKDD